MLHDLVLSGKRANIDHVVVGPAGVTVIDAKAWTGELWVGRKVIGRGRRARRAPIDGVQRQIHRVCTVLAAQGRDDVPVGATAPVSQHAMRPGRYSVAEVVDLMQMLAHAFNVAGGECRPTEPRAVVATTPPAREPMLTRRGSHRVLRTALLALIAVMAIVAALALLDTGVENARRAIAPVTRADLIRPHRAGFRALAEQRAHGTVRGPRVTEAGLRVTLAYRRGRRCRVTVTATRVLVGNTLGTPRVTSTGCRRR